MQEWVNPDIRDFDTVKKTPSHLLSGLQTCGFASSIYRNCDYTIWLVLKHYFNSKILAAAPLHLWLCFQTSHELILLCSITGTNTWCNRFLKWYTNCSAHGACMTDFILAKSSRSHLAQVKTLTIHVSILYKSSKFFQIIK